MTRILSPAGLLGLLTLLCAGVSPAGSETSPGRFPAKVVAIDGEEIDVAALASRGTLVVVTLKATWCPVCQKQLARIKSKLAEIEPCGVDFVVLSPGPRAELRAIRERIGFPYPFVEDVDLAIADRMGLRMSKDQIFPSIFILNPDLSVGWMQRGRNARFYGDPALVEKINCGGWVELTRAISGA
jgi:peroxiredoxin